MTADQQSALAAVRAVEPIAARLDRSREPEDRAADILELWQGTETALRALMGGSSLSGQGLIRELRQRELISLGQAYALLEFLGARDRANRTTYRATDNDVVVAREGYRQLEAGLAAAAAAPMDDLPAPPAAEEVGPDYSRPASAYAPPAAAAAGAAASAAAVGGGASASPPPPPPAYSQAPWPQHSGAAAPETQPVQPVSPGSRWQSPRNVWLAAVIAVVVLAGIGGYAFYASRNNPERQMREAVDAMQAGRREAARGQFSTIARENPDLAEPHVFLSRLAREEGDVATARRELETAIRLEPRNSVALREMGLILFSTGQYELARRFFVRALNANPEDRASQGYLGCTLARLGRLDEAQRFLARAGPGSWSSCLPTQRL